MAEHRAGAVQGGQSPKRPGGFVAVEVERPENDLTISPGRRPEPPPSGKLAGQQMQREFLCFEGVDLTCQHKNQTLLVEGPEIKVRPVGNRRVTGGSR